MGPLSALFSSASTELPPSLFNFVTSDITYISLHDEKTTARLAELELIDLGSLSASGRQCVFGFLYKLVLKNLGISAGISYVGLVGWGCAARKLLMGTQDPERVIQYVEDFLGQKSTIAPRQMMIFLKALFDRLYVFADADKEEYRASDISGTLLNRFRWPPKLEHMDYTALSCCMYTILCLLFYTPGEVNKHVAVLTLPEYVRFIIPSMELNATRVAQLHGDMYADKLETMRRLYGAKDVDNGNDATG